MPNIRAVSKRSALGSAAAAGAAGWAKRAADAVCDGTDEQVEIQAVIDAPDAAGSGRSVNTESSTRST
jgi:hypothetical protein